MMDESDVHVRQAHVAWNAANDRLRAHERLVASSLGLHVAGQGPLHTDVIEEVRQMRTECNARFQALMALIGRRSREDSGG